VPPEDDQRTSPAAATSATPERLTNVAEEAAGDAGLGDDGFGLDGLGDFCSPPGPRLGGDFSPPGPRLGGDFSPPGPCDVEGSEDGGEQRTGRSAGTTGTARTYQLRGLLSPRSLRRDKKRRGGERWQTGVARSRSA